MEKQMMQLQRAVLEYMDQTGGINGIKKQCEVYTTKQQRAFHFTIPIEPSDLIDLHPQLGNLVLNHPVGAAKIFQEVVFTMVKSLSLTPSSIDYSQIVVVLKIQSLPDLPCYTVSNSKHLLKFGRQKRFLLYEGIVNGMTTVTKYTSCARFTCPAEGCLGSEGNCFIRLHIPGARESQTIRNDFTCTFCGTQLKEDISCRLLADKVVVEMVDETALQSLVQPNKDYSSKRHQPVTVYLRDDLATSVTIGRKYKIIGLPIYDVTSKTVRLEANNIFPSEVTMPLSGPNMSSLPHSIQHLYQDRKYSPWSFALSLAYAFAGEVSPAGSFFHLKLGMLLSLMGNANPQHAGRLDLLAVGHDNLLLTRLLQYGGGFASRCVQHSTGCHLMYSVTKDRHGSGTCFIEGGSLLMAHHGVCMLGDVSCLTKATKHALQQVLEQSCVMVGIPHKLSGQADQQLLLPLQCSVWAYTDPVAHRKPQHYEDLNHQAEVGNISKSLADVFGMVYFAEVEPDTYADHMVIHQVLMRASGNNTVPLISYKDMQQFINHARNQKVEFSTAAKKLIQGYYVASRRVRSVGINGTTFPLTAVHTISGMAAAHAKLSLRSQVEREDAVMAIYLYEESITKRCGISVLNVQPMAHVKDNNVHLYIGPQRDTFMCQFQQQLQLMCSTHAADSWTGDTEWPEE